MIDWTPMIFKAMKMTPKGVFKSVLYRQMHHFTIKPKSPLFPYFDIARKLIFFNGSSRIRLRNVCLNHYLADTYLIVG